MTTDTLAKLAAPADFVTRLLAVVQIYQQQDDTGTADANELYRAVCRVVGAAQALPAAEPTRPANSQDWAGMNGQTAYWLIERHADGWADIDLMMGEWLAANQAAQAHCGKCDECGKGQPEGWALYCVGCLEETGLLAKEALPNAQHVSLTAADLTGPNDTAAQAPAGWVVELGSDGESIELQDPSGERLCFYNEAGRMDGFVWQFLSTMLPPQPQSAQTKGDAA